MVYEDKIKVHSLTPRVIPLFMIERSVCSNHFCDISRDWLDTMAKTKLLYPKN